jgi:hypothetical protein
MMLRLPPLLLLVLHAIPNTNTITHRHPLLLSTKALMAWYDVDNKKPWKVETLQFMAAMGVPGGGRNSLPVRLVRLLTAAETRDTSHTT